MNTQERQKLFDMTMDAVTEAIECEDLQNAQVSILLAMMGFLKDIADNTEKISRTTLAQFEISS